MRAINLILSAVFVAVAIWTIWARVQWSPWIVAGLLLVLAVQTEMDVWRGSDGK